MYKRKVMAQNQYTEVTRQGFGQKMANSFTGALLGIVLFIAAFPVLFLNEGSEVKRLKGLAEGKDLVISVVSEKVDGANEAALVCISGKASSEEILKDSDFGLSIAAVRLEREIEMYQWTEQSKSETKDKLGGGTETVTTYSYREDWSSTLHDSSGFKVSEGHTNPASMPYESQSLQAVDVKLGAYTLNESQIARLGTLEPIGGDKLAGAETVKSGKYIVQGNYLYAGQNPDAPRIGDFRVSYRAAQPGPVTVVAKQTGDTFAPYQTKHTSIDLFKNSIMDSSQMFETAVSERKTLTWLVRLIGFIIMAAGMSMMLKPLSSFFSIVPILGTLSGGLLKVAAVLVCFGLSFVTIAVAWVFYRPLIGILLLVVAAACFAVPAYLAASKKGSTA